MLSVWVAGLLKRDEKMRANLATAVERNNLLMREIHHRTKNNLQSVASLLKLQPISEEAKAAMTARIAAMSALHEQAYRSDQYSDVNLRDYLLTLVDTIRKTSAEGISFQTEFAEAAIDRDLAQPLGPHRQRGDQQRHEACLRGPCAGPHRREAGAACRGPRGTDDQRRRSGLHAHGRPKQAWAAGSSAPSRSSSATTIPIRSENGTRFVIRFPARPGATAGLITPRGCGSSPR